MKIINLTPHDLSLITSNGITVTIARSGEIARLAITREARAELHVGSDVFTVSRPTLGEITGLPPAQDGVIFIVSALVAETASRGDVMSPGELVRDSGGMVIGAKGLCSYQ